MNNYNYIKIFNTTQAGIINFAPWILKFDLKRQLDKTMAMSYFDSTVAAESMKMKAFMMYDVIGTVILHLVQNVTLNFEKTILAMVC